MNTFFTHAFFKLALCLSLKADLFSKSGLLLKQVPETISTGAAITVLFPQKYLFILISKLYQFSMLRTCT